jgi:hypothetical protein
VYNPIKTKHSSNIDYQIHPLKPKPAPARLIRYAKALKYSIGARYGAILTVRKGLRVRQTATSSADKVRQILSAGGACGGVDEEQLNRGTCDGSIRDCGGEHGADEVGEGRDAVHEDPEAGEVDAGNEDAGSLFALAGEFRRERGRRTRRTRKIL